MHTPDPLQAQKNQSSRGAPPVKNSICISRLEYQNLRRAAHRGRVDLLTGVLTRHGFSEPFRRLRQRFRSGDEPAFGFVVLDLVDFKGRVNDRRGQAQGDEVLADFGRQLRGAVKRRDLVARIGGDEFLVVLRGVSIMTMLAHVMERLRGPYRLQCGRRRVSLSAYVVGRVATPANVDRLLPTVGHLLVRAKRAEKQPQTRATLVHFPRSK